MGGGDGSEYLGDVDPFPIAIGIQYGLHDSLHAHAIEERRTAGSLVEDGIDEFDILIVSERRDRVAGCGIAL